MVYEGGVGETRGVMHFCHGAPLVVHTVAYVWHGGDDFHVELAAETLLYNLHMEQSEEAAAEAKAEGGRRFGGECE